MELAPVLSFLSLILPSFTIDGFSIEEIAAVVAAFDALEPEIKAVITALHPLFAKIEGMLGSGASHNEIATNLTIPGYGKDGGVIEIQNPDLKN